MAITSVREVRGRSGKIGSDWKRDYARKFEVRTSDSNDGPITVRTATGIPAPGDHYRQGHDEDFGSFVQSVEATEGEPNLSEGTGSHWDVTVQYGPYDMTQWPQNPLEWPLQMNWEEAQYTRAATEAHDDSGNTVAIVNSAGDPFEDPLEIDDPRSVLKITRNETFFNPLYAQSYRNVINSDVVTIGGVSWAPGTIKMTSITGPLKFNQDAGGFYAEVSYELHFDEDGWARKVLDQGLSVLDDSGKLVQVTGDDGKPVTEPVLLDGSGKQLASGGTPVFLSFNVYPAVAFSGLALDFAGAPGSGS